MVDYKINKDGKIVFENKNRVVPESDTLWEEFAKLEYEVLNNHHNSTKDPIKIARYNELKKQLNIEKSTKALNEAKEKIRQHMIENDKSPGISVLYTAITNFGNE